MPEEERSKIERQLLRAKSKEEFLKIIKDTKFDVNSKDENGETVLSKAFLAIYQNMSSFWVALGYDTKHQQQIRYDIVEAALEAGANPEEAKVNLASGAKSVKDLLASWEDKANEPNVREYRGGASRS